MFNTIRKQYGWEEGGSGIGGWPEYKGETATPSGGTPPTAPSGGNGPSTGGGGAADVALETAVTYMNTDVMYYKINLEATETNIYGESVEKWYYQPQQVKCIVERAEISNGNDDFGVNISNSITIKIPRSLLEVYSFLPEVGDVIMDRERLYEINTIDQIFITLPGGTGQTMSNGTSGVTALYVLKGYLTRNTKLNLIEYYQ